MGFNKTRLSYPYNVDQNSTQNSARGCWGVKGMVGWRGEGSGGSKGGAGDAHPLLVAQIS